MWGKDLTAEKIDAHIGPEMIGYLKQTEANNKPLANEILAFTASFGEPYNKYDTIGKLCDKIATHVRAGTVSQVKKDDQGDAVEADNFGVAMPMAAVADYVTKHVNLKCTTFTNKEPLTANTLAAHKDTIVGVGGSDKLQHWIYVDKDGVLMNWSTAYKLSDPTKGPEGVTALTGQGLKNIVCGVKLA